MDILNEQGKFIEHDITVPGGDLITVTAGPGEHVLPNGAIYSDIEKHIVKGPPRGGTSAITADNARDYNEMRIRQGQDAVLLAISSADTINPGDVWGGWRAIAENMVDIALNKNNRDAVMAFQALGAAAGLNPDRRSAGNTDNNAVTLSLSGDIARRLLTILENKRQSE